MPSMQAETYKTAPLCFFYFADIDIRRIYYEKAANADTCILSRAIMGGICKNNRICLYA